MTLHAPKPVGSRRPASAIERADLLPLPVLSAPQAEPDARHLVTLADIASLAEALSGSAFCVIGGDVYFVCVDCEDVARPEARISSPFEWQCLACRRRGTRYELERLVLEDVAALHRLMDMAETG